MKLPCAVVRDLLPLYAEKMTEPETRSLIEAHLSECPACRERLAGHDTETAAPVDTAAPLRTLKKEIRRRRLIAVLIAGLFVFIAVFTGYYHAESLKPIPWQEGLIEVAGVEAAPSADEGGAPDEDAEEPPAPGEETLALRMDSRIGGIETEIVEEEDGTTTAILQAFGRSSFFGRSTPDLEGSAGICPVPDRLIYGYGQPQRLLWGKPMNGGVEVLPRLALSYYVLLAAAAAAVSGLVWLFSRGKRWSRIPRQVFFAPVSWLGAHLLLMGTRTSTFSMLRDFVCILLVACALYALLSLLWQVWLRRRKEGKQEV